MTPDDTLEIGGLGRLSSDQLLGGKVVVAQPEKGFRATADTVLMAAAVPARAGDRVCELGTGNGAAALCLAARVAGAAVDGFEIQPQLVELARRNAATNQASDRVVVRPADIAAPAPSVIRATYDHVMANPPYFVGRNATASPEPSRATAAIEGKAGLAAWIDFALAVLKPKGSLTLVYRAERLPELLALLAGRAGDIRVLPLLPGNGKAAKRIVIQARKGMRAPFKLLPGLVLHDGDGYTCAADNVLRHGAPLQLTEPSGKEGL